MASRPSSPTYLRAPPRPVAPRPTAAAVALQQHPSLASLSRQARASQQRLDALRPALPKALQSSLAAGSLDDAGWTLLVRHAAAAAKLRQLRPHLELLLAEAFGPTPIRIKLLPPEAGR